MSLCFLYPWTQDLVFSNSIFTHNRLLCIVLRLSCLQWASCCVSVDPVLKWSFCLTRNEGRRWESTIWIESFIVCGAMTQTQMVMGQEVEGREMSEMK